MRERMEGNETPPPSPEPRAESRFGGVKRWFERIIKNKPSQSPETSSVSPPALPGDSGGQPSSGIPTPQEKSRTFGGKLPEGSTAQRLHADTKTHVEYGEKTWTTAQTIRDILQNHLDAETQQFFDKLVASVVDDDKLAERPDSSKVGFDDFTYNLFRFRKGLGSFSPDAEKEMVDLLSRYTYSIPVRQDILDEQGKLKLDELKRAVTPIIEVPPKVTYQVKDLNALDGQNNQRWLTYDELQQSEESQRIDAGVFRYQITGIKIEDQGSGFDAKLSAFYKSTKRGQRHLRGKFGEGAKMSEAHLMRHGANVKMRSRFKINGGQPSHERIWQHRAYLGEDGTVQQKGVQVDLPHGQDSNVGSFTLITVDKADPIFQDEFRANVDPRIRTGGLAQNCLEYSSAKYYYPVSELVGDREIPVGVSLEVSPNNQYVQGLRVGSGANVRQEVNPLFSYDFLDSSILQGRDRSELSRSMSWQIYNFWTHADSPMLVSELIKRVATGEYTEHKTPEAGALNRILAGGHLDTEIRKDTQVGRTRMYALTAFPTIVEAKPGIKNVVVKAANADKNKDLIALLQYRGYNIITLKSEISDKSIDNLNLVHEGIYHFNSLATAKTDLESTRNEMNPGDERVKLSQELFRPAFAELGAILEKSGFNIGDFNIDTTPQFNEVIDRTKETPFGLEFDEDNKKFRLVMRPELLAAAAQAKGGLEYWKRRIQVELLATYKRRKKFPDQNTLYIASQNIAQQILNNTLHQGLPDVDALSQGFNYEPQITDPLEAIKRFSDEQANIPEALIGWDIFRSVTRFQTNLAEMEKVAQSFDHIPEPYRQKVKDIMGKRIVVENGMVGYFDYPEDGQGNLTLVRKSLDSLPSVGSIEGKPVYQLGNKLFMPRELPKGSVIKAEIDDGDLNLVMYDDQLLDFGKYSFGPYQFNSNPIVIENSGFAIIMESHSRIPTVLQYMETRLKGITVESPERKSGEGMRFLEGVVETPFPSEYGIDEWDNPVRVFQDIVQNHLDASPTGRIDARYEVQRGQQRTWVTQQDVTATDIIVGFAVSDNGEGYTPNDLGTIGKSSKKSPLFAGKYGEGQKMIAAAAVRNGVELRFSSVADYNGGRYRWQGTVGTRPEEIVISGKPTNVDRVVFNITSSQTSAEEGYASSTIIRLPEGKDPNTKVWQEWLQVIDPRVKDKFDDGGLARYVLPMRSANGERIIDMGYTKILLDRPGEIYENGLLISTEGGTALGYDVPEVVTTRERNGFDDVRLNQYIANVAYSCPNPDYAMALMQQFKEKYLDEVVGHPERTYYIREQDLDFGKLNYYHYSNFVPSKPYWRQAYNAELGTYLIYSEEAIRSNIKYNTEDLTNSYMSAESRQKAIKQIEQSDAVLANVGHIPSDHIIHVKRNEYLNWSRLFPTVEEYIMELAEQEVPVTDDVIKALETVVSASNDMLVTSRNALMGTEDGQHVLNSIVTRKTPIEKDILALAQAKTTITEQFDYWTLKALQQNPGRVFVAPANAGYLGLATRDRIGFNERLLVRDNLREIPGTARHELIHKIYGLRDYSPEFIMMLLESAKSNITQQV